MVLARPKNNRHFHSKEKVALDLMRDKLVRAFAIAGDLTGLLNIARTDADAKIRAKAIRALGMIGSDAAKAALLERYQNAKTPKLHQKNPPHSGAC